MRRSTLVLLALAALVVAEIWLLVLAGSRFGVLPTLLVLVAIAALGGWLLRREGPRAWASLADAQAHPDEVGARLTDAALVLVGGGLLMLPGFLTDVVGLLCLIPATRGLARRGVMTVLGSFTRKYRDQADIIDARLRPDTVVPGETVTETGDGGAGRPKPDAPDVIRGEIAP